MYQRRSRGFRRRPNGRGFRSRENGSIQGRQGSNSFSDGQIRNNYRPAQSAEKLLEKYNALAKEALSSGDKTLSENYFQHADHFMRIIEDKNRNRNQIKNNVILKPTVDEKQTSENIDINQNSSDKSKE